MSSTFLRCRHIASNIEGVRPGWNRSPLPSAMAALAMAFLALSRSTWRRAAYCSSDLACARKSATDVDLRPLADLEMRLYEPHYQIGASRWRVADALHCTLETPSDGSAERSRPSGSVWGIMASVDISMCFPGWDIQRVRRELPSVQPVPRNQPGARRDVLPIERLDVEDLHAFLAVKPFSRDLDEYVLRRRSKMFTIELMFRGLMVLTICVLCKDVDKDRTGGVYSSGFSHVPDVSRSKPPGAFRSMSKLSNPSFKMNTTQDCECKEWLLALTDAAGSGAF